MIAAPQQLSLTSAGTAYLEDAGSSLNLVEAAAGTDVAEDRTCAATSSVCRSASASSGSRRLLLEFAEGHPQVSFEMDPTTDRRVDLDGEDFDLLHHACLAARAGRRVRKLGSMREAGDRRCHLARPALRPASQARCLACQRSVTPGRTAPAGAPSRCSCNRLSVNNGDVNFRGCGLTRGMLSADRILSRRSIPRGRDASTGPPRRVRAAGTRRVCAAAWHAPSPYRVRVLIDFLSGAPPRGMTTSVQTRTRRARQVSQPRSTVSSTFVSSNCCGGPSKMSRDSTTKSTELTGADRAGAFLETRVGSTSRDV